MPVSRYASAPILDLGAKQGTPEATNTIRAAIRDGTLSTTETYVRGAERLDTLAGSIYGDARYWWILAATSNIGWGLQVPPGTVILVPVLGEVLNLIS